MADLNLNTTAMPVLDRFTGDLALVRLSEKLMEWDEAPVTDAEISRALGPESVAAFRYTQRKLAGRVRKVTGEPALCHSADVAIRALSLGYGPNVVMAALLHDVVEDTAGRFCQLPAALDEIAAAFSEELAHDVAVLTNRYQLLFQAVTEKVNRAIKPSHAALDAFRAALDVVRFESEPALYDEFTREFLGVAAFLEADHDRDLILAAERCQRDRAFTFAKYLEEKLYALYIQDIARDAAARVLHSGGHPPVPLIVKSVDIIDNVRTSEVSNRSALDKLVKKAETVIDGVQDWFIAAVPQDLSIPSTIPALHRAVQIRLVDQIKLRRRAVADNFSETRFANLVRFLNNEGNRLNDRYRVPTNRIEVVEDLENEIRRLNNDLRAATGPTPAAP